jgi:pantoate--beta-alanine ligase
MRTVRAVADLRGLLAPERRAGHRIGLVPTMGSYHEGHLSLMRRARAQNDVVVVSLFVNPAQFGPAEDFEAYPRDEQRDARLAEAVGVDVLFAPPVEEVYPEGFATTVALGALTDTLEGDRAQRGPGHFEGVTTVVTKLLNMAAPDVAYFGQKDAQQARVLEQMVRDLDVPVRMRICPIVREADGLAMSSRNQYLDPAQRQQATILYRALEAIRQRIDAGERRAAPLAQLAKDMVAATPGARLDYAEIVAWETLQPVAELRGRVLIALAVFFGSTRLIDNLLLTV